MTSTVFFSVVGVVVLFGALFWLKRRKEKDKIQNTVNTEEEADQFLSGGCFALYESLDTEDVEETSVQLTGDDYFEIKKEKFNKKEFPLLYKKFKENPDEVWSILNFLQDISVETDYEILVVAKAVNDDWSLAEKWRGKKLLTRQVEETAGKIYKEKRYADLYNYLLTVDAVDDPGYWYWRGHALLLLGELEKALEESSKAAVICKHSLSAKLGLMSVYQGWRKFYRAKGEFVKAAWCYEKSPQDESSPEKEENVRKLYEIAESRESDLRSYDTGLMDLAVEAYDFIKTQGVHNIKNNLSETDTPEKQWFKLAIKVMEEKSKAEGIKEIRFPMAETAEKILQENSVAGRAFYDEGAVRYILPVYFEVFKDYLRKDNRYSGFVNSKGVIFMAADLIKNAGLAFEEAVEFLPPNDPFHLPISCLNSTYQTFGRREEWENF